MKKGICVAVGVAVGSGVSVGEGVLVNVGDGVAVGENALAMEQPARLITKGAKSNSDAIFPGFMCLVLLPKNGSIIAVLPDVVELAEVTQ